MFPLVAVLACFGLVVIYRIDEELAREQAQWFVVGLALFAADDPAAARPPRARALPLHDRARRPAPAAAAARAGDRRSRSTAPTSASSSGRSPSSRPSSAKIAIIIFLAALPARHAAGAGRRARAACSGVTIPPLKHFGPLLVVWGAAMVMLVFIRDLGSSLMFFGGFLALLYVATNRLSFVAIGLGAVRRSARGSSPTRSATSRTASTSGSTRSTPSLDVEDGGYQIAQSLFAQADGGLFGTGFGAGAAATRRAATPLLPAPQTDLIYAVIANELGPRRRLRAAARLPAARRARVQDRDARARTRSRSCWPPG